MFVDGVKVDTGPGGADIYWRDRGTIRKIHPAAIERLFSHRDGPIDVLVVPKDSGVLAEWFDRQPVGLPVWKGRIHADATLHRARRRVREVRYWDDRNLVSCVNFIARHPDPSVPEQRLLALAALAAAETRKVAFTRRRANLEALVRSGERSATVSEDLATLRTVQHGTDDTPLTPTEHRRVLRNRAGRLLHHNEAVAARLAGAATLDRCGAALTVAAAVIGAEPRNLVVAGTGATAGLALLAGVSTVAPGAEAWVWRTAATLSLFGRANLAAAESAAAPERLSAAGRQHRHDRNFDLLSRSGPDNLIADVVTDGLDAAWDGPRDQVTAAVHAAAVAACDVAVDAAAATVELGRSGRLAQLAKTALLSAGVVATHANVATSVTALTGAAISPFQVEIASGGIIAGSLAAAGRVSSPGAELARTARTERRGWSSASRRIENRRHERHILDTLADTLADTDPPQPAVKATDAGLRVGADPNAATVNTDSTETGPQGAGRARTDLVLTASSTPLE